MTSAPMSAISMVAEGPGSIPQAAELRQSDGTLSDTRKMSENAERWVDPEVISSLAAL